MSDLIDRQAAIDAIGRDPMGGLNYARILKYLPTADAVEVVRCKDCAIRFDSCPMVVRIGNFIQFFTDDEDFCSRGRREADGDGQ